MTEKLHGYFSVQLNDRFNCALFSALQFGTSFAAGVPVSAVPVISVAGAVAAVPKDPPSRVRYAIVCNLLKEAVSHVHEELYYAEDEYLNIWAFSSPLLNSVSVRNEAFYCWKTTTGFSSSSSNGEALLRDYEIVKPLAEEVALKSKNIMVISYVHTEAINCFLAIFMDMIKRKVPEETVLSKIDTYNNYQFMIKAKQYIREHPFLIRMWPDRKFLSSDYTAKEYYDYCLSQLDFEKQNRKGIYKAKLQKLKTVKLFNEK